VIEIAKNAAVPSANIAHHLSILKVAGLITGKKKGPFVIYSIRPGVLGKTIKTGVPSYILNLGCCRIELPLGDPFSEGSVGKS
jgi:hypothetical protein